MEPHSPQQEHEEQEQQEEQEDEDSSDDDDDDEEDDNDEDTYTLRFDEEDDPLAFAEDDSSGIQPYQQFERLENHYEALADKKRKALASNHHHSETPVKKSRQEDFAGASMEAIMEMMNYGLRRKSRKCKKRGRRKGSKNKLNPEVTRKLGDATLHYAHGVMKRVQANQKLQSWRKDGEKKMLETEERTRGAVNRTVQQKINKDAGNSGEAEATTDDSYKIEEAICVLKEVVRIAPNLPDPYHTLGLVYNAVGNKKKALNFYMLAAHLTPKDPSLWKLLVTWSIEQGNAGQAMYCLSKAITADPADIDLRFHRASLYVELGDYQKAAESYEQISRLCPDDVEAIKTATMV
ncbi:hypothetical protein Acr_13g0010970 [Actinidia rufa]|uniref:Tetratricopeptide repeat (TPR)-like superfamily protein n=1 Tax=Actinidia rufa TaxID=165716 RepID=A0A7J0FP44_9ERIC|nr:hypothetical protein Acr_13g0010970 [Actinidia rufa]